MDDLEEDFIKFHDEIILENERLKSKVEALEGFVKSIASMLFSDSNYQYLLKEYHLRDLEIFDDSLRNKEVYNARDLQNVKNAYLNDIRNKIENLR